MDGVHDLGGKEGFGTVAPEPDEPVFHARWEARVFAMVGAAYAAGAARNTDQFRHAIERIDPVAYLTHGYYGRWLGGLETLLVESGTLTSAEIDAATAAEPSARPQPGRRLPAPGDRGAARELVRPPRFHLDQRVRTSAHGVPGHTRLPAYARGCIGCITALHGGWVFPDTNADGRGEQPQHLYTVAFPGRTLWGPDAEAGVVVSLDLFEPYLEAADE